MKRDKYRSKDDWGKVDWSRKTTDLAQELGYTASYISQMRGIHSPNTLYYNNHIGRKTNRKYEETEFISPTGDIVCVSNIREFVENNKQLFDRSDTEVKVIRNGNVFKKYTNAQLALSLLKRGKFKKGEWKGWKLLGLPKGPTRDPSRWKNVDWTKETKDIAKELNALPNEVSVMRRKLAPNTLKFAHTQKKRIEKYNWLAVDWNKSNKQIAKELNASEGAVSCARGRCLGKKNKITVDWNDVDWTKDNYTLSQELNRAYDTVAKRRYLLGKSGQALTRKPRSDKGKKIPERAIGAVNQPIATEAARHSPKAGKFETNIHAKRWRLTREDGAFWEFANLYHFVRSHPELFDPSDVVWKRQGGKRGTGGEYCNATSGLLNVASGRAKTWKGWKLHLITDDN